MARASTAAAQAKPAARAEWPSFHGSAVPERQDSYDLGYEFIRAMHHRLSQPVTTLRFSLEVMQATLERDGRAMDQITRAMEQSDRLMELMVGFRALFEADREEKDLCPASLTYVLNEVVEDLRLVARERGVEIVFPWNTVAVHVLASRNRMRQALWNVIQNCVDLAADGDEICVYLLSRDGMAEISISDRCELAEEESARMFDPFSFCVNVRGGRKASNLPLAVMQRIFLASGAEIHTPISSEGRKFEFKLPICAARE
jgi:two-component system sensor histidine kinase SenX3